MKSCSKKILIDMIKPKKNTMHLLCRLTPLCKSLGPYRAPGFFCPKFVPVSSRSKQNNETHRLGVVAKG